MRLLFFQSRTERSLPVASLTCTVLACCALLGAVLGTGGCGGGHDDGSGNASPSPSPTATPASTPIPQPVSFDLTWGPRTRAVLNAGSINSARSAMFTLYQGTDRLGGIKALIKVNRDTRTDSYTVSLNTGTATLDARQPVLIDAVFYANPDQVGAVVAGASLQSSISKTNGALADSVSLVGEITNVQVFGTTAFVGESSPITINTSNRFGSLIPISPGSLTLTVVTGTDKLSAQPGNGPADPQQVTGLAPGVATLTASVDGATSPPVTINVASRAIVTIAPPNPAVFLTRTLQLTAVVSGLPNGAGAAGQAVIWSVNTPNGGTISPTGLYTAPAQEGNYVVQAQSVYDPTKIATASVAVTSGVAVIVSPPTANISLGEPTQFSAAVSNAPAGKTDVIWSVQGGDTNGTILANGTYTAPRREGTYTVVATSAFDNRKFGTATVTVTSQVNVVITPRVNVTVGVGLTQQFTAAVARAVGDNSVTWRVEPDASGNAVGTISPTGLYTAPAKRTLVYIRATSNFDSRRFDRVPVQITAGGADISVK